MSPMDQLLITINLNLNNHIMELLSNISTLQVIGLTVQLSLLTTIAVQFIRFRIA